MKLKNVLLASTVLGLSSVAGFVNPAFAAQAQTTSQVIVVDYDQVVQQSKAYQDGLKEFQSKFEKRQKDLDILGKSLQDEQSKVIQLKAALDNDLKAGKLTGRALKNRENELTERSSKFEQQVQDYQNKQKELNQEMQQFQQAELSKVDSAIRAIVTKYAYSHGFTVVLDSKAAVFADPAVDKTNDVIKLVK